MVEDVLRFGSLFSGIGGFELGFERAGMECAWQVENDPQCNEVLAHHWPNVKRYGDVKDVGRHNLEPVDLVCGGFPCQDVSVAGPRDGLDGERSGLWFEFLRVIEELEPQWVVIENVTGLLSSNEKRDLATILSGLEECGYWWAYRVYDAQFFGLAQRRKRVFIVGCLGDWRSPAKVLFESESSPWDSAPSRGKGKRDSRDAEDGAGETDRKRINTFQNTGHGKWKESDCGQGVRSSIGGGLEANLVGIPDPAFALADNTGLRTGSGRDGQDTFVLNKGDPQSKRVYDPSGLAPALYGEDGGGQRVPTIAFAYNARNHYIEESEISGTLNAKKTGSYSLNYQNPVCFAQNTRDEVRFVAGDGSLAGALSAQPGMKQQNYISFVGIRRLMPVECERLQGFPDEWTHINGMKDSPRYRMLGNAVAVPVAQWLGKRILSGTTTLTELTVENSML